MIWYAMTIIMTLLGAIASAMFKKATSSHNLIHTFLSWMFIGGCALYGVAAILNIMLLKHFPYSKLVPMISLTYIWTMIIAKFLFNEKVGILKVFGVVTIIVGVFLLTL